MKKILLLVAVILLAATTLTGCFGGGSFGATPTAPPQKEFKNADELKQAVASAQASSSADEENLKGLSYYYVPKTLPEGATIQYIKVSSLAVRVSYTFGETNKDTYDNQMEFVWYRTQNADSYLSNMSQSMATYDNWTLNGVNYLHSTPTIQFTVTAAPGDTASATPTPRSSTYFQLLYWVQDGATFMAATPLNFTQDDIGKYCVAQKMTIN